MITMVMSGTPNAANKNERRRKLNVYSRLAINQIFRRFKVVFLQVIVSRHADKDVVEAWYSQRKTPQMISWTGGYCLENMVRSDLFIQFEKVGATCFNRFDTDHTRQRLPVALTGNDDSVFRILLADFIDGSVQHTPSLIYHQQTVRHFLNLVHLVDAHDDGMALGLELVDHRLDHFRVHRF